MEINTSPSLYRTQNLYKPKSIPKLETNSRLGGALLSPRAMRSTGAFFMKRSSGASTSRHTDVKLPALVSPRQDSTILSPQNAPQAIVTEESILDLFGGESRLLDADLSTSLPANPLEVADQLQIAQRSRRHDVLLTENILNQSVFTHLNQIQKK